MPPEDAAISGLDDASQARVRLLQSGRAVHAPILGIGLQPAGNYQPLDAMLTALAALVTVADRGLYFTGADAPALFTLTAAGRALVDDADASAQLTTLGVSTFIKTLLDDADAATARTTLGADQAKATFASVATTSGTSIDFTSIPAGVTRITLGLINVSTSGTSALRVQLGDAGGVENTGYDGGIGIVAASPSTTDIADGFGLNTVLATAARHGAITLTLVNAATFTWACNGLIYDNVNTNIGVVVGSKSTSAALDRVRLTTTGGADTFDTGSMNISWEF